MVHLTRPCSSYFILHTPVYVHTCFNLHVGLKTLCSVFLCVALLCCEHQLLLIAGTTVSLNVFRGRHCQEIESHHLDVFVLGDVCGVFFSFLVLYRALLPVVVFFAKVTDELYLDLLLLEDMCLCKL